MRPDWCTGPSHSSQASAASVSGYLATISAKWGEPASSSPSKKNFTFTEGGTCAARKASSATMVASIGALSSLVERAYKRAFGSKYVCARQSTTCPEASRSTGLKGGSCHCAGSVG